VVPLDGVRQRFHAIFSDRNLHCILDTDHFAAGLALVVAADLSSVGFSLETSNSGGHSARLHFTPSMGGVYAVSDSSGTLGSLNLAAGQEGVFDLPVPAGTTAKFFAISR